MTASSAITNRHELRSRGGFAVVRALVILLIGLLAATPLSEHYCNFDRFLRGGQDLEFSLIALLAFIGLILLCAHKLGLGVQRFIWIGRRFVRLNSPIPLQCMLLHFFDRAIPPLPPITSPLQLRI